MKENMPNKLCDHILQTARGIGARLRIRDTGISQPMETQTSLLSSFSAVPGQERNNWHHRDRWLVESQWDCVRHQLWTPISMV